MPRRRYSSSSSSSSPPLKALPLRTPKSSPPLKSKPLTTPRRRNEPSTTSATSATSAVKSRVKLSPNKRHSIVLCEHEEKEAQPLTSYRGKKLIRYTRPIGQRPRTTAERVSHRAKREPELQSFGLKVLRAIENFIRLLHRKKLTLQGKLNVNMLYWISSTRTVKLRKESIQNLEKYSDEWAKQDYNSIGISIRDDLFGRKGLSPPADVLAWIDIMLADPLKDKFLLRYNVALLHRRAKMDLFLAMYEKLLQLKKLMKVDKTHKAQYDKVVKNIGVGESNPVYVWMEDVALNKYVGTVYDNMREGRLNTAFEFLRFVRDCIHHLMDYSVEDNIAMFDVDDKYLMLEACFPGVFHTFQIAMADAGLKVEHGYYPHDK